jgi:hypothetical protein
MPMEKPEDFAMGDPARDYCRHCARPDGSMMSYGEKLDSMAGFIARMQGADSASARESARIMMSKLPAWKDRA